MEVNLKILYLPQWYPSTENPLSGIFIRETAELLATRYQIHCVVFRFDRNIKSLQKEEKSNGNFTETMYNIPYYSWIFKRWLVPFIETKKLISAARREQKPYHASHVQVVGKSGWIAFILKWWMKLPYLVTEHYTGYMKEDGTLNGIRKFGNVYVLKKANAVVCVSEGLKKVFLNLGIRNIEVIPNRIHHEFKNIVVNQRRIQTGRIKFVHVSNFDDRQKQTEIVIRTFALLKKKYADISMTLVVPVAAFNNLIQKHPDISISGIEIVQPGMGRSELAAIYTNADILVSFSKYETFGLTIAESICCGLPCIYTKCGGPEYYMDSEMGLLVDNSDSKHLEVGMESLIQNYPFDNLKIAENARNKFKDSDILESYGLLYQKLYQK